MLSCYSILRSSSFFFFNDTATTEIYTLSLHDALPISAARPTVERNVSDLAIHREGETLLFECGEGTQRQMMRRSEEHTSELQSRLHLVCRLLLEKKKKIRWLRTRPSRRRKR